MDRKWNKNIIENRIEYGTEIIIIKSIIENRNYNRNQKKKIQNKM